MSKADITQIAQNEEIFVVSIVPEIINQRRKHCAPKIFFDLL